MTQLSHTEKVNQLKKLSDFNFTNRTMLMLAGAEDFLTQERYKYDRFYIDLMYDLAMPELAKDPTKPSKALTAVAFNGAFRLEDYQRLIDAGKKASADELKEFLTQKVDHEPKEKVVNYLSFPMLAMMTKHLKPWEASDVLLIEPNLIKKCLPDIRSKTFKELISKNTYLLLQRKAPRELQEDLKIGDVIPMGWGISFTGKGTTDQSVIIGSMDTRVIEAMAHWGNVRDVRKVTKQTGTGAKIQQWLQNNRTRS